MDLQRELTQIISFIKEAERLKDVTRTSWTSQGRRESVAEHSWRLMLLFYSLKDYFPEVDGYRVMQMLLIHDLGEALDGDTSATIEVEQGDKLATEKKSFDALLSPYNQNYQRQILELWEEYVAGLTLEAKLAKALDKIETIIQHNQGNNPKDFDFAFNLSYGKDLVEYHPVLKAFRELVDIETNNNIAKT